MNAPRPMNDRARLATALAAIRSDDVLTQNEGVASAIEIGLTAVSGLLTLLEQAGVSRPQVMYALSEIGDRRAQPAFEAGLSDSDEAVRAYAARGLARSGHPGALAGLLRTINDAPDPMHLDRTPSVEAMSSMGLPAARALVDLLLDEDEMTRLHAQRALELIVARRHGVRPGVAVPAGAAERATAEWRTHGDYAYDAAKTRRARAVRALRQWLDTQGEDAWTA